MKKDEKAFINPIDKDKITENPHTLPYAHTVGGVLIKPIDKGRIKGLAVQSMYEQSNMQLDQIRDQISLLATQAQAVYDRVRISEEIYEAEMNFEPLLGKKYHLYRRKNGKSLLSMVSPEEWGAHPPYEFVSTVKMLADHTWEVL